MGTESFNFNAKQWLGDDAVLLMDWDARAMHLQLMCLAWQQDTPGVLPADESLLRRWLGNPNPQEWEQRIKPQISRAWRIDERAWVQEGLVREWERQSSNSVKRRAAAQVRWGKKDPGDPGEPAPALTRAGLPGEPPPTRAQHSPSRSEPAQRAVEAKEQQIIEAAGFSLSSLLKETALFQERASTEERANIWNVGVRLLRHEGFDELKTRQFLGKLIQEHGEKRVAECIAQLSLKSVHAADAKSYLVGILKGEAKRRKGRGQVAL